MTTVAIEARPSYVTRAAERLSNWGNKVVGFFKKAGNWLIKKAKWVFNTKPVQWTVTKAAFVSGWVWNKTVLVSAIVWHYTQGVVLWVGVPFLALMVAPTSVLVVLAIGVFALAVIAFYTYRGYRHVRGIATPEELVELTDRLVEATDRNTRVHSDQETTLSFDDEPVPGETVSQRMINLDEAQKQAQDNQDGDKFSETFARIHLLEVRSGSVAGVKAGVSASAAYQAGRKVAEETAPDFNWNWRLMHRATLSEARRLKTLEKNLGQLTPVK